MKIDIRKAILRSNDEQAEKNAKYFQDNELVVINVMASPGAGKTSIILALAEAFPRDCFFGVIEGDVASRVDADRVASQGIPVVQINTDGGCHLDAKMIEDAMPKLNVRRKGFIFIENIGNLICPSEFDLGETIRLVVASLPEGDDKPLKYPGIFTLADGIVINKTDLQSVMDFKKEAFLSGVRAVNDEAKIFEVSCRNKEGIKELASWLSSLSEKSAPNTRK